MNERYSFLNPTDKIISLLNNLKDIDIQYTKDYFNNKEVLDETIIINDMDKQVEINLGNEFKIPTFEEFWDLFNYKHDKGDAIKAWDKINTKSKVLAMEYIPKYVSVTTNGRDGNDGCIARRYPATYLNKRTWENELPVKRNNTIKKDPALDKVENNQEFSANGKL